MNQLLRLNNFNDSFFADLSVLTIILLGMGPTSWEAYVWKCPHDLQLGNALACATKLNRYDC
jgi:hypothetical protein